MKRVREKVWGTEGGVTRHACCPSPRLLIPFFLFLRSAAPPALHSGCENFLWCLLLLYVPRGEDKGRGHEKFVVQFSPRHSHTHEHTHEHTHTHTHTHTRTRTRYHTITHTITRSHPKKLTQLDLPPPPPTHLPALQQAGRARRFDIVASQDPCGETCQ